VAGWQDRRTRCNAAYPAAVTSTALSTNWSWNQVSKLTDGQLLHQGPEALGDMHQGVAVKQRTAGRSLQAHT
jgi:hypothetical protein